ncbi:MAG: hypothetical protein ACOX4G_15040 [Limnochordia bacterium]|jgi:hypothetical protein
MRRSMLYMGFLLLLGYALLACGAEASPFAPLPTGHWTYAALSRLSASGLVDVGIGFLQRGDYVVSRYEMALWLSQALDVLNSGEPRVVDDVSAQIAGYNAKHPGKALTTDEAQALTDLLAFLRPELRDMGYIQGTSQMIATTLSSTDEERQLLELGMAGTGVLRLRTRGESASDVPQVGLGLSLDLGDVLFTVGQSTSTYEGQLDSTTELGLNVRMQNVQIKLGYSAQGAAPTLNPIGGAKRTASAGLEYVVTPESRASADVSYSADAVGNTTTTDFGLRFNQQGTSVTLGYRLVDFAGSHLEPHQDARDNIATAEFTIRF